MVVHRPRSYGYSPNPAEQESRTRELKHFLFGFHSNSRPGVLAPVEHGATWAWAEDAVPVRVRAPSPLCRWLGLAALVACIFCGGFWAGYGSRPPLERVFQPRDDDDDRTAAPTVSRAPTAAPSTAPTKAPSSTAPTTPEPTTAPPSTAAPSAGATLAPTADATAAGQRRTSRLLTPVLAKEPGRLS